MEQVKPESGNKDKQYLIVGSIMTVMFLAAIENMITSTILPSVISSIGGLALYPWVASIFMLSSTLTLPLYGKLSDIYGHKSFTLIAIVIFLIGSALCGMAQNMMQLIIFRAIQGMGAGGLITMSFILFGLIFPAEQRGKMQGLLSAMWGIASVVGPIVGALFVEVLSWRWAFYFNIPIGLLSAFLISRFLKIPHDYHKEHKLDYLGVFLFATGTLSLLFSLLRIGQGFISYMEIGLLIFSLLVIVYLFRHEMKAAEPILPVKQISDKVFRISVLLNFFAASCLFSTINFIPLFIQGVIGGSAKSIGQVLMFLSFGWVSGSTVSGRLLNRFGMKNLVSVGAILMSTGFFLISTIDENSAYWQIMIYQALLGLGMGTLTTATLVTVQSTSAKKDIGSATSGIQLARSIGGTTGIAILGGLQIGFMKTSLAEKSAADPSGPLAEIAREPHRILDPLSRKLLEPDILEKLSGALASSINSVFIIAFFISLISLFLIFSLRQKDLHKGV